MFDVPKEYATIFTPGADLLSFPVHLVTTDISTVATQDPKKLPRLKVPKVDCHTPAGSQAIIIPGTLKAAVHKMFYAT